MTNSNRRILILGACGVAALLLAWAIRPSLTHWSQWRTAIHGAAPTDAMMDQLVDSASDPVSVLHQLWQTHRLVQDRKSVV